MGHCREKCTNNKPGLFAGIGGGVVALSATVADLLLFCDKNGGNNTNGNSFDVGNGNHTNHSSSEPVNCLPGNTSEEQTWQAPLFVVGAALLTAGVAFGMYKWQKGKEASATHGETSLLVPGNSGDGSSA
jgi:hypothetical protein